MLSIIELTQITLAVTLLDASNSNSTLNNDTSVLNRTSENATALDTIDSIPNDNESGSISSLPGKCLGSALCPD